MECLLSTSDNPYNPWTQYDRWLDWDMHAGYNTNSYVARFANLTEADEDDEMHAIALAQQSIIEHNVLGIYILVPKPDGFVPVGY